MSVLPGQSIRERRSDGVLEIHLSRPEVRNAFNDRLIAELSAALSQAARDESVRAVVLRGDGEIFCAGADLQWMQRANTLTKEANRSDAQALARLFQTLFEMPCPTLAVIQGAALGGGAGLAATVDIALAAEDAKFGFTEVRLGIVPAVISTFALRKIGEGAARRYFATGEIFDGRRAEALGLISEALPLTELDRRLAEVLRQITAAGPKAARAAKALVSRVATMPYPAVLDDCAEFIAEMRTTAEAKEGISAFLEKRKPNWLGGGSMSIRRVLIANRGEIACRIIRTLQALGIESVAVHSEADRGAMHVRLADFAVEIGPAAARESYLAIDKVVKAAKGQGADAVHPGYGFLSENANFARACAHAGLKFLGPSPEAIRSMGDKAEARRIAEGAGVSPVTGFDAEASIEQLHKEARRIGVPLLVKARMGGGGKGMRRVLDLAQLDEAILGASREAEAAFGDGSLILERYVFPARHVEIQILGDEHGNVVPILERECSFQRRHQKVIEEAPSSAMTPELRAAMSEAACRLGRKVGYVGAGTVEFLLDPSGHFYFLEMNTRLQVEHGVTELVTGLDLVHQQIRIANGERLHLGVPLQPRGAAIEARVYAEDATRGFLPSAGRIRRLRLPEGPGIRIDRGVEEGDEVSPHYDPMMMKILAFGADREEARRRLIQALRSTVIEGPFHNVGYLRFLLESEAFRNGNTFTHTLGEPALAYAPVPPPEALVLALAAHLAPQTASNCQGFTATTRDLARPFEDLGGFRVTPTQKTP